MFFTIGSIGDVYYNYEYSTLHFNFCGTWGFEQMWKSKDSLLL